MDEKIREITMELLTMAMLCSAAGARDGGRLKLSTTTSLYDTKLLA